MATTTGSTVIAATARCCYGAHILFFLHPTNKIRKVYAVGCHDAVEDEAERGAPSTTCV